MLRTSYGPDVNFDLELALDKHYTPNVLKKNKNSYRTREQRKGDSDSLREIAIRVLPFIVKYDIPSKNRPRATVGHVVDELAELARLQKDHPFAVINS